MSCMILLVLAAHGLSWCFHRDNDKSCTLGSGSDELLPEAAAWEHADIASGIVFTKWSRKPGKTL